MQMPLWSALDIMNVFQSRYLGDYLLLLGRDLDTCVERSEKTEVGEHLHDLSKEQLIKKTTRHLRTAADLCAKAGLRSAEDQIGYSLMHLRWQTNKPDYSSMCAELRHGINLSDHPKPANGYQLKSGQRR